jgi:hypothetical protein
VAVVDLETLSKRVTDVCSRLSELQSARAMVDAVSGGATTSK